MDLFTILFYVLVVITVILIISVISLNLKLNSINKNKKIRLKDGSVDEILEEINLLNEKIENTDKYSDELASYIHDLQKESKSCFKKIGVNRFDAFDASGNQSFSTAILNDDNEGFVIRSMYTRDTTRVYLIEINDGTTDKQLQEEDLKALKKAISK